LCAEQICDDGKSASLHGGEQKRWPAAFDDTSMNFCEFEIRIDVSFDGNQIVFAAELI
jgi:hypothetical protein